MPPPAASSARVDPSRQAEFSIVLGDSLKSSAPNLAGVKYNFKPPSTHHNTPVAPVIKPSSDSNYTLTIRPAAKEANPIVYDGRASRPSKRAEHILLFDPENKQFKLEKLSTAFVFNASLFAKNHPPLPTDDGSDEEDDDDEESPYDYRKFMNKKPPPNVTEQRALKEERRKEALRKAGVNVDGPEDDEDENEIVIPDPGAEAKDNASEDEDDEDDEEEHEPVPKPPPPPPFQQKATKPAKAPPAPRSKPQPSQPPPPPPKKPAYEEEELEFPDLNGHDEDEDMSDEDEDDEEQPSVPAAQPPSSQQQQPPEEDEDDGGGGFDLDLEAELEKALVSGEDNEADDGGLIIEEDDGTQNRPAVTANSAGIEGFRQFMGGGVPDDDSESEEE